MIWKSFKTESQERKYFYTDECKKYLIKNKEWFNKNTDYICIYEGFETLEYSEKPISDKMYFINIGYHISNYFGDKTGCHFRNKDYVFMNGIIYKQDRYGESSTIVCKITKELKNVKLYLNEIIEKGEC